MKLYVFGWIHSNLIDIIYEHNIISISSKMQVISPTFLIRAKIVLSI